MKKSLIAVLAASLLFTLSPAPPLAVSAPAEKKAGKEFYVSVNGSDSNSGKKNAPFRTLEKARDAIRHLKAKNKLPKGGVKVYLREGRYERSGSFELRAQDSGTADKPIIYTAYPGEEVILSGSKKLPKSAFTPVTDEAVLSRIIDTDARTKVLAADLAGLGITDYGVMSRHGYYLANDLSEVPPMELYVNGQGMTLARWPNQGTVQMDEIIDPGPDRYDPDGEVHKRGGTFSYTYDRPQYWKQADDIWLDGIFGYSWEWSYNKIASIDTEAKTITLRYGEMSKIRKTWYPDFHFAQNLLEEIDMPGEYYIDRKAGKLYFMPNAEFGTANPDIEVTMLKTPMINALDASHITFSEMILENGRDSAAVLVGGNNMRIEKSEIRNFTNSGVLINTQSRFYYNIFDGAPGKNHAVVNTHIHHIGGTAVTLAGGDKKTLAPGNNRVESSHIHDFAYYHKAYNPGVLLSGVGNKMVHNELHDAPHPGVLVFGNDHRIEYNEMYDVCKTFSDLGAIYMNAGEQPHERGTVIRRNYFHNIGETKPGVEGIYPDNFTMGLKIEENVFYKMGNSAIRNNGGSYILSKNNIFVDSKVPYDYADLYLGDDPDDQVPKNYMPKWKALFAANNNFVGTPYLKKYPELANFFTENRYYPDSNTFHGNVIYNPTLKRDGKTNANGAYDKFNLVQYANNWVTNEDPGFVNLAGGDLSLRPDAPVFDAIPNFPDIPFNEIGITGKAGTTIGNDNHPVEAVAVYNDQVTVDRWKTVKLWTAVLPWNADHPALTFTSANPEIASVDNAGVVTGQSVGETVITVASVENPQASATVAVTVEAGDGVMDFTDFESGAGSWALDANRSIEKVGDNRWYKVKNGATAFSSKIFSDYELNFKLKTPETIGENATLYIFDKQVGANSTRVGYKTRPDGSSVWLLYDAAWAVLKEVKLPQHDLQPNTEYAVKMLVKGSDISVYLNGGLRLKASDPGHRASGQVGFYVNNVDHMLFDDIQFKALSTELAGIIPAENEIRLAAGEEKQLELSFDPSDTPNTEVSWQSANPAVATVSPTGVVSAVYEGQTVVTVTSAVYPQIKADIKVNVTNVMHETDFEHGGNGWPVDPNRSIAADPDGNRRYKILNGATGLLDRNFTAYELDFTLKTPPEMPNDGTMYIFDRQDASGSTRVGYQTRADGSSAWVLYDTSWQKIKEVVNPGHDLQPDTEYAVKVAVKDGDIAVSVNGEPRLSGTDPGHRPAGKVGFYVKGFAYMLFDNIKFTIVP
ncbi:Ig-like domain-containing protein [Paenibacillus sp. CN-4]|uniref:Ig-like domain-containing protein n=1 Tax=Paenibacillus nanchangensis TaxID=3348343 RepID=UPI00397C26C3